jgi:hypothetical protein
MEAKPSKRQLIERFGEAIVQVHERNVRSITQSVEKIGNPQTERDHVIAAYYRDMDRDKLIVSLAQTAIEGTLHDFLFLFAENEEFKLILETEDGERVDLAREVDVIQAFPFDWIETKSCHGLETGRLTEFLIDKLNLNETRQQRRARILAVKDKK